MVVSLSVIYSKCLKVSHALVLVSSFLLQVYVGLIAHENLMAAVAWVYGRGVHLVAVADVYAMKAAANHCRDTVCRAARQSGIHLFVVMLVEHTGTNVAPPHMPVVTQQTMRRY